MLKYIFQESNVFQIELIVFRPNFCRVEYQNHVAFVYSDYFIHNHGQLNKIIFIDCQRRANVNSQILNIKYLNFLIIKAYCMEIKKMTFFLFCFPNYETEW